MCVHEDTEVAGIGACMCIKKLKLLVSARVCAPGSSSRWCRRVYVHQDAEVAGVGACMCTKTLKSLVSARVYTCPVHAARLEAAVKHALICRAVRAPGAAQ